MTTETETLTCIDANDYESCAGLTDYRMSMSPTGISYPRCDGHYAARLDTQERIVRTYGGQMNYTGYESDGGWADEGYDY